MPVGTSVLECPLVKDYVSPDPDSPIFWTRSMTLNDAISFDDVDVVPAGLG